MSENNEWNEVHIDLRKKLEKTGTLNRFGVVHLSLWTDLIMNGIVSGSEEEPDWSKYRHITSVDPLPKWGSGLSVSRMGTSSSQDTITSLLQQEARRDEERKQESERRREKERKWHEMLTQNQEQHLMTMNILPKALLQPVHSHPQAEVVQSKTTGQFACYSKNDKTDRIQKYNTWDPPEYLYDTCSDCEGLDNSSNTGSLILSFQALGNLMVILIALTLKSGLMSN